MVDYIPQEAANMTVAVDSTQTAEWQADSRTVRGRTWPRNRTTVEHRKSPSVKKSALSSTTAVSSVLGDDRSTYNSATLQDANATRDKPRVDQSDAEQIEILRSAFRDRVERWKKDTRILSSTSQMVMHPDYQRIIGMGWSAVPLILDELRREPSWLFWALSAISDDDPVRDDDRGNLAAMAKAWITWGAARGLITDETGDNS